MKDSILHKSVFTPHGMGTVIAEFDDGTVCIRFEHGGGMVMLRSEVFVRPEIPTREVTVVRHDEWRPYQDLGYEELVAPVHFN